jgi:hypothetical protein
MGGMDIAAQWIGRGPLQSSLSPSRKAGLPCAFPGAAGDCRLAYEESASMSLALESLSE